MLNEKNPEAIALAAKVAIAKSRKIKELGITPKLSQKNIEKLVITLAKEKAERDSVDYKTLVKGQEWYIKDLVAFSGLKPQEKLDLEYSAVFAEVASEDEIINLLTELA